VALIRGVLRRLPAADHPPATASSARRKRGGERIAAGGGAFWKRPAARTVDAPIPGSGFRQPQDRALEPPARSVLTISVGARDRALFVPRHEIRQRLYVEGRGVP
jgi:hypothetical protein